MTTMAEYIAEHGITAEIIADRGAQVQDGWEHHAYIVRLTDAKLGMSIETPWKQGYGIETSPEDTPEMILDSLVSDAWSFDETGRDFEDWATEYGYDTDSLSAYRTWEHVRDLYPQVVNFVLDLEYVATQVDRL